MSICIRYTKNEDKAKEVLNMGFLKIILNLNKYKTEVPFKAWIRRVMINTLINEYKKEKIHYDTIKYVDEYNETASYADLTETINEHDADTIYLLINQLPQATRQIFNLYFVDGFKHKEIAEMLNISEGTSKWHLNAAKEKLKLLFKKKELITEKL
jgi:RNA polymerase sigma-70 factor (ECF subfamily)